MDKTRPAAEALLAALTETSPRLVLSRSTPREWLVARLDDGFEVGIASYETDGRSFADLSIRERADGTFEIDVSFWSGTAKNARERAVRAAATSEIFAIADAVERILASVEVAS